MSVLRAKERDLSATLWRADLELQPDTDPAAHFPLLTRTGGGNRMKKLIGWEEEREHVTVTGKTDSTWEKLIELTAS